jgi:hypothetical protein
MKHGCRAKTLFRIPHQRLRIEMERYDGDTGARAQARDLISQQSPVGAIGLLSIPTSPNYVAEAATNHAIQYQRGQSSCYHDENLTYLSTHVRRQRDRSEIVSWYIILSR